MTTAAIILTLCAAAAAQPLFTFDFDGDDAAQDWRFKDNTTVDVRPPEPYQGEGAMRFVIDPTEFSFGWVHRALPEVDFGRIHGIRGFFRAPAGAAGTLLMHICPWREGEPLSYFRGEVGRFEDSAGEWIEFYLPLASLYWERGPVRQLRAEHLTTRDLIQFIATGIVGPDPVPVDVDEVSFLAPEDAAEVQRRTARAARLRLLRPEAEAGGPPHPRLLLTPDQLPRYRARATAGDERQVAYERFLDLAERMLTWHDADDPLRAIYDFVETSEAEGVAWRAAFEGHIVNCSYPLETLGAAYLLTGDDRFGEHGARALVNAARRLTTDEPFLNRGFYYSRTLYVRALAFAYDWLWDRLTPDERRDVQITLMGFVRDIHEQSWAAGWGRRPLHRVWNWNPGLVGAAGVGMLALEGETRLPEQAILFDLRRYLRDFLLLGIDADGAGREGPAYLGYGTGAGVEFAEVLRRQGRGDLFIETNYHLIAPWLISETLPDGRRWNNLMDCGHGQNAWPVYMYALGRLAGLAQNDPPVRGERWGNLELLTPLGFLQQFPEAPGPKQVSYGALAGLLGWAWEQGPGRHDPAEYDARTALAHVLLYEPCPALDDPAEVLPLGLHFQGRGLVVSRTGFGPDDVHLAVTANPYAAGHDQCDKGQFTFRAYGGDLAIDSGYGNDGDPMKSHGGHAHNVVLIDGQGQPMHYHNRSSASITGFAHRDLLDWVRVDAKEAWGVRYDGDWWPLRTTPVERADREFIFVRPAEGVPPYLVVYDDIVKDDQQRAYTWQWHIPASMGFDIGEGAWTAVPRARGHDVLTTPAQNAAGRATFSFTAPEAGRYVMWGLVRAGGPEIGKSDSFFVTVNGGDRILWDLKTGSNMAWDVLRDREDPGPRVFDLAAGEHAILVEGREPQAELARWLILPADAEPPLDPDETPAGAIALSAQDAVMGEPAFLLRPADEVIGPEATMDVFPVHPLGGEVSTDWFLTSREGAHPRLHWTVQAVEPHFVAVLVPRNADMPRPIVVPLSGDGGVGVTVQWPDAADHVVFGRGAARVGGLELEGSAALVRVRAGRVTEWACLDGTRLAFEGRELHRSGDPQVRTAH